jgi:hypothetical protein
MIDQVNKTWKDEGRYVSYKDALNKLASFTGNNGSRETDTHLYKIKLMNSDNHFIVKSWSKPPEQKTKKTKNSRKTKNKKQKQSNNTQS